jgi:hypothetical protein
MSDKVDFLEFQKRYQEEHGVTDADMDRLKKVQVLTFFSSADGSTVMAKLPGGGIVFRHKDGGMHINPGETWVCELLERGTTFFAVGVLKLDAKFFFDLRSDQIDVIADRIWQDNQSILEPRFEEMYRKKAEDTLNARLLEYKKREEDALATVEEFKAEIEAINTRNKMVVSALEKELADLRESARRAPAEDVEPIAASPFSMELNPSIRRISADELYSEDFRHRNYFVHLSADQLMLTIRPHDRGNVVCLDHRITLSGLGLISPYGGPADMPAEYNPKYGGYVVYLKYVPSTSHY